jgi:hypothetical protein
MKKGSLRQPSGFLGESIWEEKKPMGERIELGF